MKRERLATWLKCIVVAAGLMLLALLGFFLPLIGWEMAQALPQLAWLYWPCLLWSWVLGLVIYFALGLFWRICTRIGRDNSFCRENAKALYHISQLALLDTVLGFLLLVFLGVFAPLHPTVVFGFALLILVGLAVAVAAALLSRLVEKAAKLKEENDLTV